MLFHPEVLWKAYISFEVEEGERERARGLYERLVVLSGHIKVWLAYAEFEASRMPIARALRKEEEEEEEEDEDAEENTVPGSDDLARKVYERAYQSLRQQKMNDDVSIRPHFASSSGRRLTSVRLSAHRGLDQLEDI
jgi:crooked neck